MAYMDARALRPEKAVSRSSADAEGKSDDGFDFPPVAHPGRELFTATVFVLLIAALVVWGGSKLIALM
jgi:hypothetical protein